MNLLSLVAVGIGFLFGLVISALLLAITAGATMCAVAALVMVLWNYVIPELLPSVASIDWLTALCGVALVYATVVVMRIGKAWTMLWYGVLTRRNQSKTVNFGVARHFQ